MNNKYYVIDDERSNAREAFVTDEEKSDECLANYSGYYIVKEFEKEEDADKFCIAYNSYEGVPPVELSCCSNGCTVSAWDYAHWNGKCAYTGL